MRLLLVVMAVGLLPACAVEPVAGNGLGPRRTK